MIDCLIIADQPRWAFAAQAKGLVEANNPSDTGIRFTDIIYQQKGLKRYLPAMKQADILLVMGLYMYRGQHSLYRSIDTPIAVVGHFTSFDYNNLTPKPFPQWQLNIVNEVDSFGVISKNLQGLWQRFHDIKPLYVRNGVRVQHFPIKEKSDSQTLNVGWVGNPHKKTKNFAVIEETVQQLSKEYDVELITQTSDLEDRDKQRIPHEKMHTIYHKMDVYTCMSYHEGLPTPLPEAMACGLPIISTDCGIVPEILDSQGGRMIPNDRGVFRQKLVDMIEAPQRKLQNMGHYNATKIRSSWSWEKVLPSWTSLIKEAL